MARAALEHAPSPRAIDARFEQTAQRQYTRTLLFSSVADLMGAVVAKIQPAVNAAYRAKAEALGVSPRACPNNPCDSMSTMGVYSVDGTTPGWRDELKGDSMQ